MKNTYILVTPARDIIGKIPIDYIVEIENEGGWAYFKSAKKNDWVIWDIGGGFQAAKLVDGKYTKHHHESFYKGLATIEEAIAWVEEKIKLKE